MNLSKIHHIAIIVSDYEAAKDFYVNKLGFSVIRENYRPERKDWKLDLRVNEYTELESLCSQQKSGIIGDMKKEYQATNYESDLTDKQWEAIKEFFPSGNKSKYHKRSLVEAVLYIVKTGCQWRMLPHDDPPHDTVWSFYRRARENGVWDKMMKHLVKITRKQAGRNEEPSYALIDSQSVKTTCYGENHGYDGGKKRREENGTS